MAPLLAAHQQVLLTNLVLFAVAHAEGVVGSEISSSSSSFDECPGALGVQGFGDVELVATAWNMPGFPAGPVRSVQGQVQPDMWGRAYFASVCAQGTYNPTEYTSMHLLGKTFSYMTDVSGSGCGCNAAMYLVSMPQNPSATGCHDYYCDANNVCGVNCHEIDIMEANKFAFHSAVHKQWDGNGVAAGYGGWCMEFFNSTQYGPKASCVNTNEPFKVSTSFPVDESGKLTGMYVTLSQNGCSLPLSITHYEQDSKFVALTEALSAGMTPVVSYWKSKDMLWLDGPGTGNGPCTVDSEQCSTEAPRFWGFSVQNIQTEL